jgi:phage gp37-like protein
MIAEAEDAIVAAVQDVLGQTVQTVETLPGPWDQDALTLAFRKMPGVWVYFDGGQPGKGARGNRLEARFMVYAVTSHASGGRERQRGNSRQIGAYEIVERVVPTLAGQPAAKLGTLMFQGLRVLTPASAQRKGVAVYEMAFNLEMAFPAPRDIGDLADFAIYHGTHHVGEGPDTESHLELPTGNEETSP